jgi:uncharacterized protein (TIGR00375 family)
MRFIADLHVHSKYSRATSRDMVPDVIWKWAQIKGITVVGTGDFTHPAWFKELKEKLEPDGSGLFRLKREYWSNNVPESCRADTLFILSSEISCIYSKNGKTRKIHSVVLVPDFNDVAKIQAALSKIGNIKSDGRPILGLDAKTLLKVVMDECPDAMLIPAHAWTPHFSIFGASSGFDSVEECYEEFAPQISAIETGLSSNPPMNWRLSALDGMTLISNSDAHSPSKMGREANIFDTDLSYKAITNALRTRIGFSGTIEFFPEEGKYHYDGHRACGINFSPADTLEHNYICPVCGKKVTVGVMHRVNVLADRGEGFKPQGAKGFFSIIPLTEILSEILGVGAGSKTVDRQYQGLLHKLGNEFKILMDVPLDDIENAGTSLIREAISLMRSGHVHITPGFDGEYGKINILKKDIITDDLCL